jgi:hypothetical protein
LRNFGLKVGVVGTVKFEARIKELVENIRHAYFGKRAEKPLRWRPGFQSDPLEVVGGVRQPLTYRATVDVPARFRNSKAVGAVFGLTPSRYQSGEINRTGAISKCGDEMMRVMLYEAAQIMLVRSAKWSWLKAWAMKIARQRGMKKAIVALARRLAVIMHRIWVDGTEFRWTRRYNWVWYRPVADDGARNATFADGSGNLHPYSLPRGSVSAKARERLIRDANHLLPPALAAAVEAAEEPFVQGVFDFETPVMANGRLALVGDAAFVVRPHTGMGVAKAAGDVVALDARLATLAASEALRAYHNDRAPVGASVAAYGRRLGSQLLDNMDYA